ncbi:MAG: DUF222 domain-containing protein, partial [Propionibacteriales bacterium]|nr:DUF222 domain-containing protein [Propionibacteriales bacterium]
MKESPWRRPSMPPSLRMMSCISRSWPPHSPPVGTCQRIHRCCGSPEIFFPGKVILGLVVGGGCLDWGMSSTQHEAFVDLLDQAVDGIRLLPAGERIELLDAAVGRLQAAQATAVREAAGDGTVEASGCRTIGAYLRLHLRRDTGAHRLVRRAVTLPELPVLAAAYATGQVCDEHVDLIGTSAAKLGVDTIARHEQTLVELCRHASTRELREALTTLSDLADPDADRTAVQALGDRSFRCRRIGDLVHVDAMVEPALGEALKTAVEHGARASDRDGRSWLQRCADAFSDLVLRGIGADHDPDASRLRPQVCVTVTTDQTPTDESHPDQAHRRGRVRARLEHFGPIPSPTAERLSCDGDLYRVVLDTATGLPLDVGRRSRLATRRQRRALKTVHTACAFPGCAVPFRFCEIHHVDWWSHGGRTDLALLVPYCWAHHHFLHEGGFTVTKTEDQLTHHRPDGAPLPDPGPPLRRAQTQLTLDTEADRWHRTD